jgi:hypothetical protein
VFSIRPGTERPKCTEPQRRRVDLLAPDGALFLVEFFQHPAFAAVMRAGYQGWGFSADNFGINDRPIFPVFALDDGDNVTACAVRAVLLPLHAEVLHSDSIPYLFKRYAVPVFGISTPSRQRRLFRCKSGFYRTTSQEVAPGVWYIKISSFD